MDETLKTAGTRTERKRRRNQEALIAAGYQVISAKGIDAATMGEIAEIADVGSGTVYNYFASKDDLVVAVMERVMHDLAERIQRVTDTFDDPADVYAFGVRSVMHAVIEDHRWRGLLPRSEVAAQAMYRVMGPYALRDLRTARDAGRYDFDDAELVWNLASHAIVAFGLAVHEGALASAKLDEAVVALLGMAGVAAADARRIVRRDWPELPAE